MKQIITHPPLESCFFFFFNFLLAVLENFHFQRTASSTTCAANTNAVSLLGSGQVCLRFNEIFCKQRVSQ